MLLVETRCAYTPGCQLSHATSDCQLQLSQRQTTLYHGFLSDQNNQHLVSWLPQQTPLLMGRGALSRFLTPSEALALGCIMPDIV